MNTETKKAELKWYHIRRLGLTREYCAGTIAGFGFGIMILAFAVDHNVIPTCWNMIMVIGAILLSVGLSMEKHIQRQRAIKNNDENN